MSQNEEKKSAAKFGSWRDAEELRKWSFLRRTPQQRLEWLVQALEVAYRSGALEATRSGVPASGPAAVET